GGDVGACGHHRARPGGGDGCVGDTDGHGDVQVVHQRHLRRCPVSTSGTFNLNGSGVADGTTFTFTPGVSGSFAFQATYSGDGTYNGSTGACEPLAVTKVASSTVTD